MQGTAGGPANVGGSSSGNGGPSQNADVPDDQLQLFDGPPEGSDSRTASSNHDSDAKVRNFEKQPWFAKLPPELRKAIQAKSRRKAPRGYEDRLKKYFENID